MKTDPAASPMPPSATLPGAVMDGRVVIQYGNPIREQQLLAARKAFTDLSYLEAVVVTGEDRAEWLHKLATADFCDLPVGASTETLFLDSHGKILHAAAVQITADAVWLITDISCGNALAKFLTEMRFMFQVEITRPPIAAFGTLTATAELPEAVTENAEFIWQDPWPRTATTGANYGVADADHPGSRHGATIAVFRQEDAATALASYAELAPAGQIAWEAQRVFRWRPRPNNEAREAVLPHELDWLRTAVHLHKGCYPGQEAVAKIVNMGKPPRRLTYLYLEGPTGELPPPGAALVTEDGVEVGKLTSVAQHAIAGPVGLALLRRNVPVTAILHTGEFVASQIEIVSAAGKSSVSPATRPGAELRPLPGSHSRRGNLNV